MPIIEIKTLPIKECIETKEVMDKIAEELSVKLKCHKGRFVIYWDEIRANHLMSHCEFSEVVKESTHHPIVDVCYLEGKSHREQEIIVKTIVEIISQEIFVDKKNVCVVLNEMPKGKIFVNDDFL